MTKEEIAWCAGLFEGEGCFYINTQKAGNRTYRYARACIHSTDLDVLERFYELVGVGTLNRKPYKANKLNSRRHKYSYSWSIQNYDELRWFGALIKPWLGSRRIRQFERVLQESTDGRFDQRGVNNPKAKLLNNDVKRIRSLYPKLSQGELAKMFRVSRSCIQKVVNGENWAGVR